MTSPDSTDAPITCTLVPEDCRLDVTAALFGLAFAMRLEPYIYSITENLASEYRGGYWDFFELSNGGFYMAPSIETRFHLSCPNGNDVELSGDALGIACCLYAYSLLSFDHIPEFSETCGEHYHLLREFMLEHAEVGSMLRAID